MIYVVTINNTEYEVEVELGKASIVRSAVVEAPVTTAATPVAAPAAAPVAAPAAAAPAQNTAGGEMIKSPMPGTILDVKVTVGAGVKKGDILLVLEAMKMENEIVAPHDGTVAHVAVQKGAIVSTGDALISIK